MCAKNNTHIYVVQTSNNRVIAVYDSIVACCHRMKLCALATRAFQSQQNGPVTRMWRLCQVLPSQKNVWSVQFIVKTRACCCNPSTGVAWNVRFVTNTMRAKNNTHIYVARTSNNRVIVAHDLYCCMLSQCEALHTCHSGFPITSNTLLKNFDNQTRFYILG